MNIEQIEIPALKVLAFRRVGPYGPGVAEAFAKLCGFAGSKGLFNGASLVVGVYYDCPKCVPPEQCRMDACLTLNAELDIPLPEGFRLDTLRGGLFASYLCNVYGDDFRSRYDEFQAELKRRGGEYGVPNPNYEFYYGPRASEHPWRKWTVEILFPLKSRF